MLGVAVRLLGLAAILLVSYVLVGALLSSPDLLAGYLGIGPAPVSSVAQAFASVFQVVAVGFVFIIFTVPAALALFGKGGAWVKHVIGRTAKSLLLALLAAFELDIGSAGATVAESPASALILAGVLGAVGVLLVALASPLTLLDALGRAVTAVSGVSIRRAGDYHVAAIELLVSPTKHLRMKDKPERIRSETIRFERFVQALVSLGGRVEFRLSFRSGRGRILILARSLLNAKDLRMRVLSVVYAHFPEFGAAACDLPDIPHESASCVSLIGVPEATENPLEPLSRYFLESCHDGDYQVILEKTWVNPFLRFASKERQKRIAQRAEGQKTRDSALLTEQSTESVLDYAAKVQLEESSKLVERRESSFALKCWVYVRGIAKDAAAARGVAEGASSVLVGSLSGHRSISALKARPCGRVVQRLEPKGSHALLVPKEAVPYFWIPQVALGTLVAPSAEFELPPRLEGEIELGKIVVHSSPTAHDARVPVDALTKHLFITGMTGSGKTTSCFNLLLQLHALGIPFLVIEPVKSEYRSLLTRIPGLQVFTVGDEETAPFRLNIFEPPPGVRVQTHLESLEAAWNASFVMYAPLPYVVREILAETYKGCGWDVRKNTRGEPIAFDDFQLTTERVTRRLGYEPKVTMDIEAALKTRIRSMALGGKGPLFNTVASIPLEDVLRRPTVIELKRISNNEEKAFVASLLLLNLIEYREARGNFRQLQHLTLIEEAHRLLPNVSTAKGDPEAADPRKGMVEQFANMLAEVRAYGEGLAIVEQIPTKIIPDALKNTATKIAHRVPAADDREVLAGAMNLTKAQTAVFAALEPGQAILSVERHPLPVKLRVPDVVAKFGVPVGEVGDSEVKKSMTEFYLKNPLPRPPASYFDDSILPLVDSEWFKAKFIEAYRTWLKTGTIDPLDGLVSEVGAKFARDEEEGLELARKVLALAVQFYLPFDERDRERFPRLFMQEVRRKRRVH